MYILIVGAGAVGSYLARLLIDERHDVAIVEKNSAIAQGLEGSLDALVIHGSGVDTGVLRRAGLAKADLVIAITSSDEVNIIVCLTARKFGREQLRTIARIREEAYLKQGESLDIESLGFAAIASPERAAAEEVTRLVSYDGSGEIHHFCQGRIALLELPLTSDSPLVHETLHELRPDLPPDSLVVAARGHEGLRIPKGNDRLRVDERAYVLTASRSVREWWILSGQPWHHVEHVLLIGCGTLGFAVARALEAQHKFPTIIERNRARAKWVATQLKGSLVLHGDGTDAGFLREQLSERCDAVVSLVDDDHQSIVIGLFAKELGAKKVIVRCDQLDYAPIAYKLGVDALISPERSVAAAILKLVAKERIKGVHVLGDHEAELLEMRVPEEPRRKEILTLPLSQLELPPDTLLGAVVRGDAVFVASGDTVLRSGDDLLVVTKTQTVDAIEKMLA